MRLALVLPQVQEISSATGTSTVAAVGAAFSEGVFNSDGLAASNVIIVDFSAAPPTPAVGAPYGAGPSRKRFRELLRELEEEAREAEAKARQVKGKARKKLRQVAEAAHAVAEAQRLAESTEVQSQIVTLSNIIEGAVAAKTTTEIIQESNVAIAAAKEIMDELDDLEAIALLVA